MFHHHLGRIFLALFPTTSSKSKLLSRYGEVAPVQWESYFSPLFLGIPWGRFVLDPSLGEGFFMLIRNGRDVLVAKKFAKWQLFTASLDLVHRWLVGKNFTKKNVVSGHGLKRMQVPKIPVSWWGGGGLLRTSNLNGSWKMMDFLNPLYLAVFFAWGNEATENVCGDECILSFLSTIEMCSYCVLFNNCLLLIHFS